MITITDTPVYEFGSPAVACRWVATECPVVFEFARKDFTVVAASNSSGYLRLQLSALFTGTNGDSITVFDSASGGVLTGTVTNTATAYYIITSIPYSAAYTPTYLNDNTLRTNYYLEARLTINDVVGTITLKASPNAAGAIQMDVSGLLRIATMTTKVGDYSARIIAETSKSGKFTIEYREVWVGSSNAYTAEGNTWYYVQAVRSEEQGCNLHEYVMDGVNDAVFFNTFSRPTYFAGLPFDLSFIWPADFIAVTVTIKTYNASNVLLSTTEEYIEDDGFAGYLCSVNIDPEGIEANADHFTIQIT